MYLDVWGSFLSSMFVIGGSYVSSLRSHVICIASSYLFVREMSDLLLRTSSHCLFHHYIHYWCDFHFMFDLGRSPLFFTYPLFRCRFYRCLWFISFPSHLILSLQRPISGSMLTSHHHYTYHYQFILLHLPPYRYHIHIRHPQVQAHEVHYTCCISYMRAWVLIIGYLSLVFSRFYHPITLAYVTSRVLRPPWGHGIRCCLQQPLLGQVIEIWLIFRYCHASSSGSRLFDV